MFELEAINVAESLYNSFLQIDASIDGSMLLELYSRDGVGTMISTDFYEGIRGAGPQVSRRIRLKHIKPILFE